ncbi:MAG: hypothetical protein IM638_03735 [Bacteroidetes bacterium]|nr:hypothetical protein [Bacteroidota bacterium]
MKTIFALLLFSLTHSVIFSQTIQLSGCDKRISIVNPATYLHFFAGDTLIVGTFSNSKKRAPKQSKYAIASCKPINNEKEISRRKMKNIHPGWGDLPDSVMRISFWIGKFNGYEAYVCYRINNSTAIIEISRIMGDSVQTKELIRFPYSDDSVFDLYRNLEVLISPDETKLAVIYDRSELNSFSCMIDQDMDVYKYDRVPKTNSLISPHLMGRYNAEQLIQSKILSNDGLLFYTFGEHAENGSPEQEVICIDIPNKETYKFKPEGTPVKTGWVRYISYHKKTYAIAPMLSKTNWQHVTGFAFWQMDEFEGTFKTPQLSYIPDSVFMRLHDYDRIIKWSDDLLFFDLKENGFIIIGRGGDDFFMPFSADDKKLRSVVQLYRFNSNLENTNAEIIETVVLPDFKNNSLDNTAHLKLEKQFFQTGNSIVVIYNSMINPAVYGQEKEAPKASSRCTVISSEGRLTHYEFQLNNMPAGQVIASNCK